MPGKRVSMRKTREVLRLYFELKLRQRQIARSANVSQSTVHEYVERFRAAGLKWPLPAEMPESDLEEKLFPADPDVARPGAKTPTRFRLHSSGTGRAQAHPLCSCCGKSTEPRTRTDTGTAVSAITTSAGSNSGDLVLRTSSISRARSCSWIGRARPCPSTIQ